MISFYDVFIKIGCQSTYDVEVIHNGRIKGLRLDF